MSSTHRDDDVPIVRQGDIETADCAMNDRPGYARMDERSTSEASEPWLDDKPRVGRFIVLGTLGRGGMGVVLRAYDGTLGRMVALKLLNRRFSGRRQQRLLREGQALALLSHPNVVQVYEMGMVEEQTFIAMELVDGEPLRAWQNNQSSWMVVLDAYLQAGRGLAAAHGQGLVHRDFKPENCIMGGDGRVRVLDFGLAHGIKLGPDEVSLVDPPSGILPSVSEHGDQRLTRDGAVIGTMRYLPLQQLSGRRGDEKSDQFSFCVSLYEGLYGQRPFADESLQELIEALETNTLRPVSRSGVPARLRKILLRGLALDPRDRWPSMDDLLTALERVRRPHHRWRALGALLVVGASTSAVVISTRDHDPCKTSASSLDEVWNRSARGAMKSAFFESGDPEMKALHRRVEQHIEEFSKRWTDMAEQSCQATFVEYTQSYELFDRRVQCLQRHENRLRSALDSLNEATTPEQVVERAILPFKLTTIDECADVDTVMVLDPLPNDEAQRERILHARANIDRAATLREAGEFERGLTLARAVVVEARASDHLPLLAESLEALGHLEVDSGASSDGQTTLEEAIEVAARAKADVVAARAWALLMYALLGQGKLDEAVILEPAARAAGERADDAIARGWLLNNLGAIHGERGDYVRSIRTLERSLEIKRRALGDQHVDVGIAWFNLGRALEGHGSARSARRALERAQEIFDATVGRSHPYAAHVESSLGGVYESQGDDDGAMRHYRRALAVWRIASPTHPALSRVMRRLGQLELRRGRHARARELLDEARDIDGRTAPTQRPEPELLEPGHSTAH